MPFVIPEPLEIEAIEYNTFLGGAIKFSNKISFLLIYFFILCLYIVSNHLFTKGFIMLASDLFIIH